MHDGSPEWLRIVWFVCSHSSFNHLNANLATSKTDIYRPLIDFLDCSPWCLPNQGPQMSEEVGMGFPSCPGRTPREYCLGRCQCGWSSSGPTATSTSINLTMYCLKKISSGWQHGPVFVAGGGLGCTGITSRQLSGPRREIGPSPGLICSAVLILQLVI